MANSRLEELRRRAQERIQEVREAMERGEDVSPAEPPPPPEPPRAPQRPTSTTAEAYRAGSDPRSLEGPSLEGPGYEVERPQPEAPRQQPQRAPTATQAAPPQAAQRRPAVAVAGQRARRSGAAKVLNKNTLRQAMLAQEILGKPVAERPPQGLGDL